MFLIVIHNFSTVKLAVLCAVIVSISVEHCECQNQIKIVKMFNEYLLKERSDLTNATVQCLVTEDGTEEYMRGVLDGHGITWTDSPTLQEVKKSGKKTSASKTERTMRRCMATFFKDELSKKIEEENKLGAEKRDIWTTFKGNLMSECLKSFDESHAENVVNTFLIDICTSFDRYVNSSLPSCQFIEGHAKENLEYSIEKSYNDEPIMIVQKNNPIESNVLTDDVRKIGKPNASFIMLLGVQEEDTTSSAEMSIVNGIHSTFLLTDHISYIEIF